MTTPNTEELMKRLRWPTPALPDHAKVAADTLQSQAERIEELEADVERKSDAIQRLWKERDTLRTQLADYETRLSAVMPSDFDDWHNNNPNEWPEVAAWVIRSMRERRDELEVEAEQLRAQLAESISDHGACKSANSMLLDTIAELEKQEPAESKDAERYQWLAAYLVSNDTLHDDALIACASVDAMTAFIDSKGAK